MSGMPVYVAVRITNHSAHSVSDIVVELLRRQHTFLRRSDEQEGTSLIPLTSSCTVSAHTSAEKSLEWYLPVQPGKSEEATLVLQAPKDQWSIRNRMFMDISFSIRVSLVSRTARGEEQSLEIPIFLTHPVSVDPLPSLRVPPPENSASDPGRRQREGDLFYALDRSRKSYSLSSWESALDEDSELEYPSDDEDLDLHNDLQVCHRALSKN
ncbi:hypothetical protein BX666DRAFT_1122105 [Dichotomocladium elegans]|nr:hypothetical protein BX666DRAFT_1122105 [Dichotomocladium elegans]